MKRYYFILTGICLLLSACSLPLEYSGYKLAKPSWRIDVFHSTAEAKMHYTVMGRITSHRYQMSIVEDHFVKFAKSIGADAIIILPADSVKNGPRNRIYAEALQYR